MGGDAFGQTGNRGGPGADQGPAGVRSGSRRGGDRGPGEAVQRGPVIGAGAAQRSG